MSFGSSVESARRRLPIPSAWPLSSVALHAMGVVGEGTSEAELDELPTRDDLVSHLHELVDDALETRQTEHGEEVWSQVERFVLLRTIDSLWVEHLTELDDMRRGIGLRGYAQQDPLNEFRREAFQLYGELRDLIRHQVASTIFRVTVTRTPPPGAGQLDESLAAGVRALAGATAGRAAAASSAGSVTSGPAATSTGGGAPRPVGPVVGGGVPADPMARARLETGGNGRPTPAGGARPGFTPTGARIGRNDPCWCGSGQKYKKCHGR